MKPLRTSFMGPTVSSEKQNVLILAAEPVTLTADLAAITSNPPPTEAVFLCKDDLVAITRRSPERCRPWATFRFSPKFDGVCSLGVPEGLALAALQHLRGPKRPIHFTYDCRWYGGNLLKKSWMRFCLKTVDYCVVWTVV